MQSHRAYGNKGVISRNVKNGTGMRDGGREETGRDSRRKSICGVTIFCVSFLLRTPINHPSRCKQQWLNRAKRNGRYVLFSQSTAVTLFLYHLRLIAILLRSTRIVCVSSVEKSWLCTLHNNRSVISLRSTKR